MTKEMTKEMTEKEENKENGQNRENPLGYEKISVLLKQFAIPSIVAMLVSSLYNIVDQIFIGNGVGYLGNGATNVAFPLSSICMAIALLVGIGSAARFSLELGRGNKEEAASSVGNAILMAAVFGIIYCIIIEIFKVPMLKAFGATGNIMGYALDYVSVTAIGMPFLIMTNITSNLIRADGSPRYSMICMIAGAVVNIILDPIFIFKLGMEVKGAAIATVISQVVSFVCAIAYYRHFKQVRLTKKAFRIKISECLKQLSLGLSNSLNQIVITIVQIVMNNSLTYYGGLSKYGEDIPVSAVGVILKINTIFLSVFVGLSQGSQPILGFNYGAKQYDRVKETFRLAVRTCVIIGSVCFIFFEFCTKYILTIFGNEDELYMEFAVMFMRIFLFMIPINGVQKISSNLFSAIGKPLKGTVLSLSGQLIVMVPAILILGALFGIEGIPYAGPIADTVAFIVAVIMVRHEFKKMA